MNSHLKSNLLVALQFLLIGLLLFTTSNYTCSIISGILILSAITLIVWAIMSMQKSKLRISPVPASDAVLIITGPYKYIRHPMYTAILSGVAGLLAIHFTWIRLSMAIALAIVLIIKLNWEEEMLNKKFDEYKNYSTRSRRIIPFVY